MCVCRTIILKGNPRCLTYTLEKGYLHAPPVGPIVVNKLTYLSFNGCFYKKKTPYTFKILNNKYRLKI